MKYEAVIGLEVHAQLLTESKLFCSCSTKFGEEPNSETCPVCLGMPGVLPVLNEKAVEFAVRAALAMNCQIAPVSRFARKNYFYPDLPKGYQISQYEQPLATRGYLEIETNGVKKRVGITRIHLEEDAGKLLHQGTIDTAEFSYVDLNRAAVPLVEIVSEPDIRSPEEAAEYMRSLRSLLRYLEICDGNMEEGSLRCDANVSLRPMGSASLGVKTEVKNMNSFKNVERALSYEIARQTALLERGEEVIQETRLWDAAQGITLSMRGKEEAHDYRYFSEPDLPSLVISQELIEGVRRKLPELPHQKRERFVNQYGIPPYDARVLTASHKLADYYEECVRLFADPKTVSNWIMGEVLRVLKEEDREPGASPVTPARLASILTMVRDGTVSAATGKELVDEVFKRGLDPQVIVKEKGLLQVSDEGELLGIIDQVMAENPKEVGAYRAGKEKLFAWFVGQVMKKTRGKANPAVVNELLKGKLG